MSLQALTDAVIEHLNDPDSTQPVPARTPPPEGVRFVDEWQAPGTPDAYRNILGTNATIIADSLCDWDRGQEVTVWNHIVQFPDGSFDLEGRIEKPGVSVSINSDLGITAPRPANSPRSSWSCRRD